MTIKDLSNELGVSEQALRQWCKKNNVRKESTNETKGKQAAYFLDEKTVEQIKSYYSGKGKERKARVQGKESNYLSLRTQNEELKAKLEEAEKKLSAEQAQKEQLLSDAALKLEEQKQTISSLQHKLSEKENELEEIKNKMRELEKLSDQNVFRHKASNLEETVKGKDRTINNLEQDKKKLNERLDIAEANISNLTIALKAAQALHGMDKQQAVIETTAQADPEQTETAPAEPEKKRSFFNRLFGKR